METDQGDSMLPVPCMPHGMVARTWLSASEITVQAQLAARSSHRGAAISRDQPLEQLLYAVFVSFVLVALDHLARRCRTARARVSEHDRCGARRRRPRSRAWQLCCRGGRRPSSRPGKKKMAQITVGREGDVPSTTVDSAQMAITIASLVFLRRACTLV